MPSVRTARHDGLAALPDGAAVSQCPGQLLFERQKETWREGERRDPETGDRLHRLVAAEGDLADLQEQVRGDAGDQQSDPDREGAFRKGSPSNTLVGRRLYVGGLHQTSEASGPDGLDGDLPTDQTALRINSRTLPMRSLTMAASCSPRACARSTATTPSPTVMYAAS